MKLFIVVGLPSDERPLALVLLLFLALSDGLFYLYDRFWDMLNVSCPRKVSSSERSPQTMKISQIRAHSLCVNKKITHLRISFLV